MKLARRKFLHLAVGAVALPVVSRVATAQTYPTRPITVIVPIAAGGGRSCYWRRNLLQLPSPRSAIVATVKGQFRPPSPTFGYAGNWYRFNRELPAGRAELL